MLKKITLPVYVMAAGCLLGLVAFIIGIVSNGIAGYEIPGFGLTVMFTIFAIVLLGGAGFTSIKFGNQHFITAICRIGAILCLSFALTYIVTNRVEVVSTLSWDRDNQATINAWNTGLTATILYVVAVIAVIVSGFFGDKEKAAEPAQA